VCDRPHSIGVVEREINRDATTPAMANYCSAVNAESIEESDRVVNLGKQFGWSGRTPEETLVIAD
jgi:hypothetical protein